MEDKLGGAEEEIRTGGGPVSIGVSFDGSGLPFFLDTVSSYRASPFVWSSGRIKLDESDIQKLKEALEKVTTSIDRAMKEAANRMNEAYLGPERNLIEFRDTRL